MSFFKRIKEKILLKKSANKGNEAIEGSLKNSSENFIKKFFKLRKQYRENSEEFLEKFEELLVSFDMKYKYIEAILNDIRIDLKKKKISPNTSFNDIIAEKLLGRLEIKNNEKNDLNINVNGPSIYLIVGINGSGKTSVSAKLAYHLKGRGGKVLLVAADTFRAAAAEQLEVLCKENKLDIFKCDDRVKDPSAVIFSALNEENIKRYDFIIIDTAGRLENKVNLINELAKMRRIIEKKVASAPHESILVLDSTVGQNGLSQARVFKDEVGISSIIITKLDGTSKGGIVFSIKEELGFSPIYASVGEKIDNFFKFDSEFYLLKLVEGLEEG